MLRRAASLVTRSLGHAPTLAASHTVPAPSPLLPVCGLRTTAALSAAAEDSAVQVPTFAPSFSRRARRERLKSALSEAALGNEFVIPEPELRDSPGPCGAVMNVLTESSPLTTSEIFEAVEARYPGVLRSKTHLKQHILKKALVNKLMKVQVEDARFKDRWQLRKPGQIRMRIARDLVRDGANGR